MKTKKWYRLDNSGKIFPPITNEYDTCVFRISCTLNEEVDKEILAKALEQTLVDFPVFNSVLRKGFFWYYIEEINAINEVKEEKKDPCDSLQWILYRVTYYKKKINLEVNHALTDGYGATTFLRCMVANYLKLKYKIQTDEEIDVSSTFEKSEDAFKKYYKNFKKHKTNISKKAYKIKSERYDDYRVKFIEASCKSENLIAEAKKYSASISEFLTSILIKSILKQMTEREKKNPIFITVPVSLRKEFPTSTTRNFFCTMSIFYKSNGEDEIKNIVEKVKEQYKNELKKDNLYSKMSEMIFLESIPICRVVPRFIKDIVLRTSYSLSRKTHTMTFSNLGKITMPEAYNNYIKDFSFSTSTDGIQLNLISFNDEFKFSFSSHFINSEIQKNFIRELIKYGAEFEIDTNILEEI